MCSQRYSAAASSWLKTNKKHCRVRQKIKQNKILFSHVESFSFFSHTLIKCALDSFVFITIIVHVSAWSAKISITFRNLWNDRFLIRRVLQVDSWHPQFSSMWLLSCCYAHQLCQEHVKYVYVFLRLVDKSHIFILIISLHISLWIVFLWQHLQFVLGSCPHLLLPPQSLCELFWDAHISHR